MNFRFSIADFGLGESDRERKKAIGNLQKYENFFG